MEAANVPLLDLMDRSGQAALHEQWLLSSRLGGT
jgi:hypothetical protein